MSSPSTPTTTVAGALGALALACLGACFIAPGEVLGTASQPLACEANQRAFNGACRDLCDGAAPCAGGLVCAGVDDRTSLCLEPGLQCSYLGDDTECAARGGSYAYGGRGSYATWIPYSSYPGYPYEIDPASLTSYDDPAFSPYGYQPNVGGAAGCQGNAQWISLVPAPGAVACRGTHFVNRCRLVAARRCELVLGTTVETVLPAAP
jgi:hypothetical protein